MSFIELHPGAYHILTKTRDLTKRNEVIDDRLQLLNKDIN